MKPSAAITPALVQDSRQTLAKHARSFKWASVFLPNDAQDDAAVVYAFCRLVDDLADEAPSTKVARTDLSRARAELMGSVPRRPLIAAFVTLCETRNMPLEAAIALLDGVESDLEDVCIADDGELLRYCYRVAGTVGLMMCGVLGVTDPKAIAPAIDLGIAMQLTNISRDVREDAERGRTYLPADRLIAAGTTPESLITGNPDRVAVAIVTRDLIDMADIYYRSARNGLRFIPWRARFAITVASAVYRAIGTRLRRAGSDPWVGRTMVGSAGKVLATLGALLSFLSPNVQGWTALRPHRASLHRRLDGLPGTTTAAVPS
ncbi:MAG: phytoene synthase [Myxococcota bacterium]